MKRKYVMKCKMCGEKFQQLVEDSEESYQTQDDLWLYSARLSAEKFSKDHICQYFDTAHLEFNQSGEPHGIIEVVGWFNLDETSNKTVVK